MMTATVTTTERTLAEKAYMESHIPKVLKTEHPLYPVSMNSGPRIGKIDTVQYGPITVQVNYWYDENGRLLYVR